ncbi:hypothetical protein [Tsukamurella pseudospumae]|uniref:Uncharacterized protein n=1 Tax=Tsukamurella pseudospumae TaxID=239498 RepID=A0A138AMQ6_9ACTN|nr:hypothetical protein [Tsukamurella pseudospumae]KXP11687.1 hypothetical protein AXK60_24630 [Tsukamurella pseudospumae]
MTEVGTEPSGTGRAGTAVTVLRALLVAAGVGLIVYGALRLTDLPPRDLLSAALWAVAILVAHDGVFAPLCLLAGHAALRVLPPAWWPGALCGALAAATVSALAAAVALPRPPGKGALNPTVLDQPYGVATITLLVAIALAVVLSGVVRAVRGSSA